MFSIQVDAEGVIHLAGRFHAAHVEEAAAVFSSVEHSCTVSFAEMDYIASAGLTILLETQLRLAKTGHELYLAELPPPVRNVFRIAGFDSVFQMD